MPWPHLEQSCAEWYSYVCFGEQKFKVSWSRLLSSSTFRLLGWAYWTKNFSNSNIENFTNSVLFYLVAVCKSQALPMLEFLKLPTSSSSFSEFVAQEMEEKVIWAVYPWNTCPWTKFNRKSHSLRSLRNLTPFGCKRASSRISSHPWWVSGE